MAQSQISTVITELANKCLSANTALEAMQYSQAAANLAIAKDKLRANPTPTTTKKIVCTECKKSRTLE
jgi:hypothetical protein